MMRPAKADDVPYIQRVLNDPGNLDKLAAYSDADIAAAICDQSHRIWIWEVQGDPAAFIWITGIGEHERGPKIEEFGATVPGQGVGTLLFRAAMEELQTKGLLKGLWLAVAADNGDAIRLYQRLGFKPVEVRQAVWQRRSGPVADALYMVHSSADEHNAHGGAWRT